MPSPVHLIQCLQHAAPDSFARGSFVRGFSGSATGFPFLRFGVQLEIQLLALGMVGRALGRRQIGSHQIFVDLGKQGLVGVHAVEDATFDRLVPELAHRFETMRTDDQEIIRIPARPDNDRLQRRFV
jgi:hypothetical protein